MSTLAPVDPGRKPAPGTEGDYSGRLLFSYMVGVYTAFNAIRDAFLLVDGPDCAYMKTHFIQGNQDYMSCLTSVSGFHRVANTALRTSQMHQAREELIQSMLERMAAHPEPSAVGVVSMPCLFITGVDYARICRTVREDTGKPAFHVPGNSLSHDWLRGYSETLFSLASQIELTEGRRADGNVAIVGNLYDRNEEDNNGNLREFDRMLKALGLNPVCVWLSGDGFTRLSEVRHAETIIGLPYGLRAARTLAQRTGARLLEMPLPFGLHSTEEWVRRVGAHCGVESAAEDFIQSELRAVIPKLEWVVPFLFQHRSFGYVGDPFLLQGLLDTVELVGGQMAFAVVTNCAYHLKGTDVRKRMPDLLVEGTANGLVRFLEKHRDVDCIVTNNTGLGLLSPRRSALVEFGFPSFHRHALYDRPYLGFNGFLAFIDTLANTIRFHETFRSTDRG